MRPLSVRLSEHRKAARLGGNLPVHQAWRKYGEPIVEVIGVFETAAALNQAEKDAIVRLQTLSPSGYNLGIGGESVPTLNPDVARRVGDTLRGRVFSPEARARMSAAAMGKKVSEETRAKMSLASKGRKCPPASDEKRRNLSIGIKAAWADPIKRARLVAARQVAWETRRRTQREATL